jgi:hypothetical protein
LETFPQTILQDDEPTDSSSPTEPQKSSSSYIPILRCVDKPSSSLPFRLLFTEDSIRASVGFCRIDTIKKHFKTFYQDTVVLDKLPPDAVLDMGDFANIPKSSRNTTPVTCPSLFLRCGTYGHSIWARHHSGKISLWVIIS